MPQVIAELAPDGGSGPPLSRKQIEARQRAAQWSLFERLCHEHRLTPAALAALPYEQLAALVRRSGAAPPPTSHSGRLTNPLREWLAGKTSSKIHGFTYG